MEDSESQIRRYEFKKALNELTKLHGRGTELISLYIPPDKQISDVVQYLREEFSTSSNIKSKSTRKNVLAAIESIMSRLKYYKAPPETGLVFFVGHVATRGDQTEMYTKIIEPPEPFQTFMYKCDSVFHLEQLQTQLGEKEIYGLIVMDRKEATVGVLSGTKIPITVNAAAEMAHSYRHIVMGGTEPGHTTDTVSVLLAERIGADIVINATSVDGVYSADPRKSPDARKFSRISYDDAIKLSINASIGAGPNVFMDITSLNIAKRSSIEIHVVNGLDLNVYSRILSGVEHDGTVIGNFGDRMNRAK